ncbi:hypothetical protein PoB_006092000 [Plakobranchus ocellatus]|uniref:Mariner Mos1 transposase n=1 Tax=Plakobranchus ocellatus TaxID=259542 RepID=A0AAV4CRG0_9GAST|nr:hypothetical protein PoB_006092000 [Plakobranchus ocellatus]
MLFDAKDLDSCEAELSFNRTMQPPHTAKRTKEWLERYSWDVILHPAHSPALHPQTFIFLGLYQATWEAKSLRMKMSSLVKSVIDFQSLTQTFSLRAYTRFSHGGKNA